MARVKETRPFTDQAFLDATIDIDLYDWAGNYRRYAAWRGRHDNIIRCENVQDLLWFLEGQRPAEYPGMRRFLAECSRESRDFHAWLSDPASRRVTIDGQQTR